MSSRKLIAVAFAALFSVSLFAGTAPASALDWFGSNTRSVVNFKEKYRVGTIIVKTKERRLYLVQKGGKAIMYKVGVGRPGFAWKGKHRITRKAKWPGWTPPAAMRKREPWLPAYMKGGIDNPLGARALYIGSTLYRLHGTTNRKSIGQAVSSGCIRLLNKDIEDLYERVKVGARIIVM
ncbi:ErfK/YbiS/YcfS/YnhG [hydrothermal vent metagenome]|uniref:ErfK/YbiS/YcfS/YnhG n=1 Tax=hydrothermal vent metagenome TaxID=652676 RepID=A0A3B0TG94_9ZZZZ